MSGQLYERITDRARKVLDLSLREALQLGHNYIAPSHILLAVLREGESEAFLAIKDVVNPAEIRRAVLHRMQGGDKDRPKTDAERIAELEARVAELEAKS